MFQKDLEGPELVEEEKRPERPSTAIDEQYVKKSKNRYLLIDKLVLKVFLMILAYHCGE